MMQLTVEIDVLIARMLIPRLARLRNMRPAMPGRSRKSGPKIAIEATSACDSTAAGCIFGPQGFHRCERGRKVSAIDAQDHLIVLLVVDDLHHELNVQPALVQEHQARLQRCLAGLSPPAR